MNRREKRNIRKQIEQELRERWDHSLEAAGRMGEERLTESERAQLMGIALSRAILWGIVTEVAVALLFGIVLLLDGLPDEWWWAFLNGPLVASAYFIWKRRQVLDRSAAIWQGKRRRHLKEEVARRVREYESQRPDGPRP